MAVLERIEITLADITKLEVDAIVNAANTSLLGGGGVDGAIHHAAGPQLVEECRMLQGCKTGQAKITQGYRLPAKFVIHTVGPVWQGRTQGEPELLASCYVESLRLAVQHDVRTIAFPAISCGIYRYPINQACDIALRETLNFLNVDHKGASLEQVIFACFSNEIQTAYQTAMSQMD
jgi:O-acetyl-ADP-ribose deacetylase (regulator of RNase III)